MMKSRPTLHLKDIHRLSTMHNALPGETVANYDLRMQLVQLNLKTLRKEVIAPTQ
jgi:hypothetical protein